MSEQSKTAANHLRYEKATRGIELLYREEELRQLRLRNVLLSGDVDQLNEKLWEETERGDNAEFDARDWQAQAEEAQGKLERTANELRLKSRELETLRSELASLEHVSADSTKILTEKLALARELASLRPELEHLRDQATSHDGLLAENFSLQRQLSNAKAELENEKRSLQRQLSKQGKSSEQDARYETEIERLKEDLAKERRGRAMWGTDAAQASAEQLDQLRKELSEERRKRENVEHDASNGESEQLQTLRKELTAEKKEREKAEKAASKGQAAWEVQKTSLEDKLEQFRNKLRSTKDKLKETEDELRAAQNAAGSTAAPTETKTKGQRKRPASQMDFDATIGTPGDAGPNKRVKRASSVVGEKSTFSITPFLNRTSSSVLPPSSPKDQQDHSAGGDAPVQSIEDLASPSAARAQATEPASIAAKALAPARPSKTNPKVAPQPRKKAATASLTLDKVAEEAGEAEDAENIFETAAASSAALAKAKQSAKPVLKPKALASFASFRDASLPPQPLPQHKKKRKLLGGAKTLFDEEDEEDAAGAFAGAAKGRLAGVAGQRAFGAFGGNGLGGLGLFGGGKKKGPLVTAADGFQFQFSPLKKERRAMAAAAAPEAAAGEEAS